jgi:cysteine desulfuration protein SufE
MTPAEKLDRLAAEMAELEPRERLEVLLEFAERLPPLPERYRAARDAGEHKVHECQTPVFLWAEVADARVQLFADVAPEAPTVKGFVGILVDAFSGGTVDEVLAADARIVEKLGLVEALGMMRMRGLHAVTQHIRRLVAQALPAFN